jgi:hypothetical protein
MKRETSMSASSLSRRTAVTGLGLGAATTLASIGSPALARAQESNDLANHPLLGTWAVMTDDGIVPQTHYADGSFIAAFAPNFVDAGTGNLTFQGPGLGRWESTGERAGRFTFLQALTTPEGKYAGTFQLTGDIEAKEDGESWSSTAGPHIVIRDAANTVVFDEVVPLDTPVIATRIRATPDAFVLPDIRPGMATPTS